MLFVHIKLSKKDLQEKLDRIEAAVREIRDLTLELDSLGVIDLADDEDKEEAASGN